MAAIGMIFPVLLDRATEAKPAGSIKRHCDHLMTQGIARKSSMAVDFLRDRDDYRYSSQAISRNYRRFPEMLLGSKPTPTMRDDRRGRHDSTTLPSPSGILDVELAQYAPTNSLPWSLPPTLPNYDAHLSSHILRDFTLLGQTDLPLHRLQPVCARSLDSQDRRPTDGSRDHGTNANAPCLARFR